MFQHGPELQLVEGRGQEIGPAQLGKGQGIAAAQRADLALDQIELQVESEGAADGGPIAALQHRPGLGRRPGKLGAQPAPVGREDRRDEQIERCERIGLETLGVGQHAGDGAGHGRSALIRIKAHEAQPLALAPRNMAQRLGRAKGAAGEALGHGLAVQQCGEQASHEVFRRPPANGCQDLGQIALRHLRSGRIEEEDPEFGAGAERLLRLAKSWRQTFAHPLAPLRMAARPRAQRRPERQEELEPRADGDLPGEGGHAVLEMVQ